jgi:cytochrome P450
MTEKGTTSTTAPSPLRATSDPGASRQPDITQDNPLYVLLDPAMRIDPHPTMAQLRAASPIVTPDSTVIIGDYATCVEVMRNPAMGNDTLASPGLRGLVPNSGPQQVLDSIFFMDGTDHARQRRLISKAFTPRITARYRPWIENIVDELFPQFLDKGSFDVVSEFANLLSIRVICELLDVPMSDVELLKEWSDDLALATELPTLVAGFRRLGLLSAAELAKVDRTSASMHAYFADLIFKRRRNPGDDLVSSLISTEDRGQTLARHEVTNVLVTLFAAAHESVTNLISNGILALHRNRDQLALLRSDLSLAAPMADEVLRYDAPVQLTARVALSPTTVGGLEVEAGTVVILLLAAANRDEAEFEAAEEFRIDRRTQHMQLAFGAGAHFCIGSSLTKLEAELAFRAVAERFTDFEVDEQSLVYRKHVVVRGLQSMTVRFSL